ncbi:Blue copper protein [Apostasia shenzhenica]|uniref:Blue copper protein n=1 Tax=Apostasia shenzhenica TaxID=1088818 RepID=A0A2I0A0P4_9ASPA|nr:Blue copper protein [Apostasia shenzhenica]
MKMARKTENTTASSSALLVGAFVFLLCSFLLATSTTAAKINVGGSLNWTFGFNYTDWALKSAPFFVNDSLMFKYDPPNSTTHAHSVYLLKDSRSLLACDLRKATLAGNVTQGTGEGFEFTLRKRKNYFFVCGELAGFHCSAGLMRFSVRPIKRRRG